MKLFLIVFCFLMNACTNFSAQDITLQTISQGLLVADWGQTLDTKNHAATLHESNPILGRHPSDGRVDTYFASCIVGNQLIVDELEGGWRTAFQAAVIIVETAAVSNNHALGIKINF